MRRLFNMILDDDDAALLDAVAAAEKLTKADVVRRLIRKEAKRLGVVLKAQKGRK
jgi:hypothetical protein